MGSKEAVVVKVIGDRCEKDNHSIMNELCMGMSVCVQFCVRVRVYERGSDPTLDMCSECGV